MSSKKLIKFISVVVFIFFCSSCANIEHMSDYKFKLQSSAPRLTSVNIIIGKVDTIKDSELHRFQYQERLYLRDTLYKSLTASGIFQNVSPLPNKYRYTLKVSYQSEIVSNQYLYSAEMLVSAATIFMLPVKKTEVYSLKVDLLLDQKRIKTYCYKDPLKSFSHISNEPRVEESIEIDKLVKSFLTDLYSDGLLPKE